VSLIKGDFANAFGSNWFLFNHILDLFGRLVNLSIYLLRPHLSTCEEICSFFLAAEKMASNVCRKDPQESCGGQLPMVRASFLILRIDS
jgi:hypothetical protein